ncbi:hypothetical protein PSV3_00234 [Septimatrevirus PSV33]|uniref:Uncharacterized protein n=1 Tax=Pseudomonas phage PSV3 TaxID=3003632 RepID=A0AAE9W451_9CAUD|nr:hypothetical protein PM406_gp35 [Pseudomonas phage PSV3]WBF76936.1 hypothetical protein PSV3_00234 [Pseudomonas phage PSV3]
MWIAIVFVVAFLLMAALMPKPNVENARAAKLGDFQFPRSKYGDPMPLVWGTVRQKSPITAWERRKRTRGETWRLPISAF